MFSLNKMLVAGLLMAAGISTAYAGVIIGGTRVIYNGNSREASISVNNPDSIPYLIQSWFEPLSGGTEKPPFVITPPLYRLDKEQQNVMRIISTAPLPENRESMYWLNIKAIPSAARRDNTLQVAVKTRIKLIYRPASLKNSDPEQLADKLTWQRSGQDIQVTNPGANYINFNEIAVAGHPVKDVTWVAPGATARFALPPGASGSDVAFKIINDYGGTGAAHHAVLK